MAELINGQRLAWMRVLIVTFTSKTHNMQMRFTQDDLAMSIEGDKYMSAVSDTCTIKINNLSYSEIIRLISGEFFDVVVECGYQSGYRQTIFKGGVLYISNSLNDRKTTVTTILCTSEIIARLGQKRLNLSLQSGINIYSAIKFVCDRAGLPNTNVSESFKSKFLQEVVNANDTLGNWLETLTKFNDEFILNADDSTNSGITIFNVLNDTQKVHILSKDSLDISGGYPQLNSTGLTLTIMPTISVHCGELIQIDPALIDMTVSSQQEAYKNYALYLDPKGQYMVNQMHYALENRGSAFSISMTCKSRSLLNGSFGGYTQ